MGRTTYASSFAGLSRTRFEYTWYPYVGYSYTSGFEALLRPSDFTTTVAPPRPDACGSQFGKNTFCFETVPSVYVSVNSGFTPEPDAADASSARCVPWPLRAMVCPAGATEFGVPTGSGQR